MDDTSNNGSDAGAVGPGQVGNETEIETESTCTSADASDCSTVASLRENFEESGREIMTSRVVEADNDLTAAETENTEHMADEGQMGNTTRPEESTTTTNPNTTATGPERSQPTAISHPNNHQNQEGTSSHSRDQVTRSTRPFESREHTSTDDSRLQFHLQSLPQPGNTNSTRIYRCSLCGYAQNRNDSERLQRRAVACPSCYEGDLVETREVFGLEPQVEYRGTDMRERNMLHMNSNGEETNNRLVQALKTKEVEENEETGDPEVDERPRTPLHTQTPEENLSQMLENCDLNADSGIRRVTREGQHQANAGGSCNTLAACSPLPSGRPICCSLPCQVIVFQRGPNEISLCFRYAVYIIPTEFDFDKSFSRVRRDETNIHQSFLVYSTPADVLEYLICTISLLCRNHDFWITQRSGEIVSQETIFQQSCQRLIKEAISFAVERDPNSHGWGYAHVALTMKCRESSEIRVDLPITSYHGTEDAGASSCTTGMSQDNRDTIRICSARLIHEICDLNKLLHELYQHDVLEGDDVERIRNRYRNRKDQVMFLLIMIQRRGDVLDCFIDILQSMKSNKKAAKILCEERQKILRGEVVRTDPVPMSDADRRAIRNCYEELIREIQNENQILVECYSRWILDEDKVEEIMRMETRRDRVQAILDIIMRSGCTLLSFVGILRSVGNNARAMKLLKKNSL